ncbi:hypothetical protein Nepgr_008910 [Nepenthes gracilis]|uniref:RING-type domain-containing protein n=1 Tax=Nepenthes gracilis TaxID=150966 RepID=A0AAD3S9I7_NEPGR|nr:hypothetical protein Nepgr_008910 [Nepenthes gracilis]
MDALLLEDFGQKVDLTRRIREVLLNYPEGTTVLKELIQNADDAGATKVKFCLDRRVHGVDSLLSDKMAQWQGPALLAYNDAVFTEEDFVSISRIGGSSKHGQAWKTGRFGVGFNSVYHLTDLPSFVSGKYLVVFDPQGIYLPNISAANPGKRIEFVSSSAITLYKDQFIPYCAFGCDMKNSFGGTLFRFPLRNADQAAQSRLSRQAYSEDDIFFMFTQLYEEGVFSLLFLKSVLFFEMYVWDVGEPEPRKLYSCSVSSVDGDAVSHRQLLMRLSKSCNESSGEMDAFKLDFLSQAMTSSCIQERVDTFYIVQTMASGTSRIASFATTASKEYDIQLLPWASVAACVSASVTDGDGLKLGRVFCFLPLPMRTGLTVQVNGYFELSSNRRGIWYGADMDRSGKIRSLWNRLLLEDVIAPAFTHLLTCVQDVLGPTKSYYSLYPSGDFEEPWNILVECIYRNAAQAPVFYSDIGGGKWVSSAEAFLHVKEFNSSDELGDVLVELGMPVVRLPNYLHVMLLKYTKDSQQKVVTPETVRHFLRECGTRSMLGSYYKLLLLEYCLEDLIDSEVGRHAYNLPLLPLASGEFGTLSEASKGISYFLCNELEYRLLERISDRVISRNIPKNIFSRLFAIADSSGANLFIFTIGHFIQLFNKFVPSDWRCKSKVVWKHDDGHNNHPASSWFRLFWEYLRYACENLSPFEAWPILPSTSGHLYRASKQSKMINAENLPQRMRSILDKIGCKILDCNYGVEHCDLSQYVSDANGAAVLTSIFDVVFSSDGIMQTHFPDLKAEEKDDLCHFLLDPKWYFGGCMVEPEIQKCKRLPIYRVYGGESAQSFQFSDLIEPQKYLPPVDVPRCFLGSDFVCTSSNLEDEILNKYYGLPRMGRGHFYRRNVFSRIGNLQPEDRDRIMLSVLQELPQLCNEDSNFKEDLKNMEFIPTCSGAMKCPTALYDPRNEELHALLEDTDLFPCGVFLEFDVLDILQGLGLRTSVFPETIIQCARHIEHIVQKDPQNAYLRGQVLLAYLEANAHRLVAVPSNEDQGTLNRMLSRAATAFKPRNFGSDLEKFWSDLRMICWCPVLITAPYQALPWPVVTSTVAPPKLVRLKTDMWLASASMRILDGECSSTALSYHLGWSSPLSGSVIAAQILELGKNNEIVTDQFFRQELALAMPRVYARLMQMTGSDEMDVVKAILEGCRWIWVGDGFATSDEVVLSGPLHLAPYIRIIPVDLAVFKELFLELGIREFLNISDYVDILCRMAVRKGANPLTAQELTAATLIVQHLAQAPYLEKQVNLYLPDASGQLISASDLVYNDAPWLLGLEDSSSTSDHVSIVSLKEKRAVHKFVHGNVSNDVAERLGVCSLRRLLLAESADSVNLCLSGAAEAFGQHEALTTRLKHIIEMYADGPGILFELIQNAEDAGASEVIFLLDKTQYGTSSVLSPEMANWQGPALYCYNDSVFSPQDLYAISRIGQESKLEKPFAIGRFGLGFNCVYHFTDIPSFVSGENIVMFDPHACNLPGISPSHPGLRIRFVGRRILEQFPDQFSPFLFFGCDLQHPFPGTLFRFPLRTASVAAVSQIKKEGFAPEDVMSLFSSFSEVVSETLLFLHRVKSISIFVKDGSSSEMQLLHCVQRHSVVEPESESNPCHDMFNYIHGSQRINVDKDQLLDKLSKSISDRDLPWRCQKVVVREQSTSHHMSHRWIVSECLGSGKIHNDSRASKTRTHSPIPWATVAAYLHSVEVEGAGDISTIEGSFAVTSETSQAIGLSVQSRRNFEGRAFCFLPLPLSTGLPAHVNAYFELSSNRRDIWLGNDMSGGGKKRSDWNMYLLEHVAAPAYAHLLEKMALEIGPCDLFFSFFPTRTMVEPWSSMMRKLYMFIADAVVRVLYTKARGGRWISTKQALFPDFTFDKMLQLVDVLSDAGLPLVSVSPLLVERFVEVRPSLHYLTPQLLRTLLIRRKCGFNERSALILTLEYCLFDLTIPVKPDCLYGLPLVPLANGLSTTFNPMGVDERIYIARGEEYGLLKDSVPSQLVDMTIPEEVYMKLCDVAQSEESNIYFLNCPLLEKLFLRILPVDWQNAKQVTWVPGHNHQPNLEWMRVLWSYLRSNCDDLAVFSRWPILPVENNLLMQLVKNSNIIEDEGWSENLSSLLRKVGCLFLSRGLPIEHPQLKYYVQSPTATGISNALLAIAGKIENIEGLFADALEVELHELRSFFLQSKWFCEAEIHHIQIEVIKHVPLFESFRSRKLVTLSNGTKWLKPNGVREDLLDDNFIRAESEREKVILRSYLNVQEVSKAEFYKDYVLSHMSEFLPSQEAVSAILHDVKLLVEEDVSIKTALSGIPFVRASNGIWQQPCRLYDPRIPELRLVLHKEVFFPSDEFSDPAILDMLVDVGLMQNLGYTGLLDSARTVSILHDFRDPETRIQGRRLLACLDALGSKLSTGEGQGAYEILKNTLLRVNDNANNGLGDVQSSISMDDWDIDSFLGSPIDDKAEEEFWSELKTISWCPIYADPPLQGLPWLKSSDQVTVPSSVRPKSQMWVISSAMHILDAECCSTYVQCKLGWVDPPKVDILSTQLIALSNSYAQIKLDSAVDPVFNAELQKGVASLYSMMQEYINTDDFKTLKSLLQGVSCIWIGDGFVSPWALAFDSPVKFQPYLYVVPSELSDFRDLLLALGIKPSFDASDYVNVLQRLKNDMKGSPLSSDQLNFVQCVLEAVADCFMDKPPAEVSNAPLLVPDSSGILMFAGDLVYNDAPWMEHNISAGRNFVHPSISNSLASRLGVQSLRFMSFVDEEMAKDLPCMDYARISELLTSYASSDFLIFDLIELADCCNAKKLHIIFDKREHSRQSLLQHNLGEFQGPALLAVFEDASLSREEVSSLQFLPPWRLRSDTLNYGLGLLSSYLICDVLSVMSAGYYYLFDPCGLALAHPSSHSPAAKVFTLTGTNLSERFHDQFSPMFLGQNMTWLSQKTVIRMPLSSACMKEGSQDGFKMIKQIYNRLMEHGSRVLLFLKSVMQVTLSTWEEGNVQSSQNYSVCVDSFSAMTRNPFSEKKWKKFHLSRLFSGSSVASKMQVVDVNWSQGESKVADRWLIALSLGSGQTRNMALDRRYLAYNLTPVAGIAAHISRNGHPADTNLSSPIMSPLPLSANMNMPVTVLGCFLVRHNKGRYLFKIQEGSEAQPDAGNQLIEAWNKELMACVRDSYIEIVREIQKFRKGRLGSMDEPIANGVVGLALKMCSDYCYSLWPRSHWQPPSTQPVYTCNFKSAQVPKADWECIIECVVRPFYVHLADLPVWQLYSGNLVKVDEGMFLSQPGHGVGATLLPETVCNFVKEHYPVFSVPWDLITEIQAAGLEVREIKPKMVRDLLRISSISLVIGSVDEYVDVLEYCLSDIQISDSSDSSETEIDSVNSDSFGSGSSISIANVRGLHGISPHGPASSGGDALEMMTSLGKALLDFGRVVVEDIGKVGGPLVQRNATSISSNNINARNGNKLLSIATELRSLPCPTATEHLAQLGITDIWIGNKEQHILLAPLVGKFIHLKLLDRPILADIFSNRTLQSLLNLHRFSLNLLANHMSMLFHESWVNHVLNSNMAPWFSWENNTSLGGEGGPSPEWIRLFWRIFNGSSDDLPLFADWPLIPAFLGRPVLCRVRERHVVFIPPPIEHTFSVNSDFDQGRSENVLSGFSVDHTSLSVTVQPYLSAFRAVQSKYPWLLSLLNQCNIPLYDPAFLDYAAQCDCLPELGQSLGQVIASKLVAAKHAGYFPELTSFLASDREELFNLFVSDFPSNSSNYGREEIDVLRALPIYKTQVGSFTRLDGQDLCMIASNSHLKPFDEHCLCCTADSGEGLLLRALGVPELLDQQILVRFELPQFECKTESEQEDILIYIYRNWQNLQVDSSVVEALMETRFVRNADEFSLELSRPKDLFDPNDVLLISVFSGERKRFPGDRFSTYGWLQILRILGLRTAAEADIILECAQRIGFLGSQHMKRSGDQDSFDTELNSQNEISLEIWSLAESVVEAIFSNFAVFYSNNFCNALSKIACVPAEGGFPNNGGRRGGKRVLTSYSEAILLKDWPLAWSCAPIISRPNIVPPEYSWGALHLKSPPVFSTVLKHLQVVGRDGGGDTLAHWPVASGMMTVEDASCEILKYLENVWGSLSSSDILELQSVAFLTAANGTRLVKASSLFVRLTVNLSPFAFELPTLYLPFMRVLKDLGLRESLSISSAKDILLNLQNACGYQHLNPNELRAVLEILNFICSGTDEANKADMSGWDTEAVVPDDGCRLVHARSCVYLDFHGSRFVKYIDSSRLRFVHPDIPETICLSLGIRKLSEVVVEELLDEKYLQPVEKIGSVSLALIRQKLLSRSFQVAVCKIFSSIGSYIPAFGNVPSERIQLLLEDAAGKLQFVSCIHTRFLYIPRSLDITHISKNSTIPQWEEGSHHRALYYMNSAKTCILVAEPPSYISVTDLIAIVVSDILDSPTPLPLGSLFLCPEDSESVVIDILKLFSDKKGSEILGNTNDLVGKEILPPDALQVQIHPMRPFYVGEIVAWRLQNGEKLRYGRVPEDVRPSAGQSLYRFKVETAPGVSETLLSSQVFSFRSASVDTHASSALKEDGHTVLESNKHTKMLEGSGRGKERASQMRKGKDLQYGRVSPAELMQAVQEMLSAAGISMDIEKQSLLQTNLALQEKLKESREAFSREQNKADAAAKEADTAKATWQCRICLSSEVDVSLVPCGHVLCRRCSSAVSRCPFCRIQVSKAMRIFRP